MISPDACHAPIAADEVNRRRRDELSGAPELTSAQ
jgi:hypothetical protein